MDLLLRLVIAAGLAIDAYVHFHLATTFDALKSTSSPHLSQGQLFRVEAIAAIAAAVLVLVVRNRLTALLAFVVAAGGVAAVLLYTYVDIGEIGPLPAMYDPSWYTEKTGSLIAEAVAAVAALACVLRRRRGQDVVVTTRRS